MHSCRYGGLIYVTSGRAKLKQKGGMLDLVSKAMAWRSRRANSPPEGIKCVVASKEDLDRILTWPLWLTPRTSIALSIPCIQGEEAKKWEQRINELAFDCGCVHGTIFFVACLVACSTLSLVHTVEASEPWSPTLWQSTYLCICAAIVGKIVGLIRKRLALGSTVRRLKFRIAAAGR